MENTENKELLISKIINSNTDKKCIEIEPVTFKSGHTVKYVKYIQGESKYFNVGEPCTVELRNGIIPVIHKFKIEKWESICVNLSDYKAYNIVNKKENKVICQNYNELSPQDLFNLSLIENAPQMYELLNTLIEYENINDREKESIKKLFDKIHTFNFGIDFVKQNIPEDKYGIDKLLFKVGTRITHKNYGDGTIIKDDEQLCKNNEIYVHFDNNLPSLKSASETRAFSVANKKDIVLISDVELINKI